MIELAALRLANLRCFRHPRTRRIGVAGHAPVRRIDQDRAARLAVDAKYPIARIDPERVVAADHAGAALPDALQVGRFGVRALAKLAADWRRGAVRIAWRLARLDGVARLGLVVDRRFFSDHQRG